MTKKQLFFILLSISVFQIVHAQNITPDTAINRNLHLYADGYTKAIGVKMYPGSLTYKSFYNPTKAIESSGYITLDGLWLSIVNEIYTPINDDDQLTWFYGYGGHLGIWSEEWRRKTLLCPPTHKDDICLFLFIHIYSMTYESSNTSSAKTMQIYC